MDRDKHLFSIGNLTFDNRVIMAPLAGITDKAYRIIAGEMGCGLTFTEMVSDQALIYENRKTLAMLDIDNEPAPLAVQIFGSSPDSMARAAEKVAQYGAKIIDINMGCPTPKIVKNGEGSALMRDLPRAREIIRAVVKAVEVPVTVKMRKGWDDSSVTYLELGRIADEEGVSAVTLHARTREQFFSGHADWSAISQLKQNVSIPVIGNGDIFEPEDAWRMIETTNCDAVMIGRGCLGNPFIFASAKALLDKQELPPQPALEQRFSIALRHFDLVAEFKGMDKAISEMRKQFAWYLRGVPGAARARQEINQAITRQEIAEILSELAHR
ncbi:MAG: tRNA dihydrouridine synthase DusB [Candidatus Saccharibacteria bacterium]